MAFGGQFDGLGPCAGGRCCRVLVAGLDSVGALPRPQSLDLRAGGLLVEPPRGAQRVRHVGPSAARSGLLPGDLLLLVDGAAARTPASPRSSSPTAPADCRPSARRRRAAAETTPAPAPWDCRYLFLFAVGTARSSRRRWRAPRPARPSREALLFAAFALRSGSSSRSRRLPPLDGMFRVAVLAEDAARALFPAFLLSLVLHVPAARPPRSAWLSVRPGGRASRGRPPTDLPSAPVANAPDAVAALDRAQIAWMALAAPRSRPCASSSSRAGRPTSSRRSRSASSSSERRRPPPPRRPEPRPAPPRRVHPDPLDARAASPRARARRVPRRADALPPLGRRGPRARDGVRHGRAPRRRRLLHRSRRSFSRTRSRSRPARARRAADRPRASPMALSFVPVRRGLSAAFRALPVPRRAARPRRPPRAPPRAAVAAPARPSSRPSSSRASRAASASRAPRSSRVTGGAADGVPVDGGGPLLARRAAGRRASRTTRLSRQDVHAAPRRPPSRA